MLKYDMINEHTADQCFFFFFYKLQNNLNSYRTTTVQPDSHYYTMFSIIILVSILCMYKAVIIFKYLLS